MMVEDVTIVVTIVCIPIIGLKGTGLMYTAKARLLKEQLLNWILYETFNFHVVP